MSKERILVVDGDIALSEKLRDRLEQKGYLVSCARNGNDALEILNDKWVDAIIMSIILRGRMHGFQLLKEIKKNKKISKIPVLVHCDKPGMKKIFQGLGVCGFYSKPCQFAVLLKKIKQLCKKINNKTD